MMNRPQKTSANIVNMFIVKWVCGKRRKLLLEVVLVLFQLVGFFSVFAEVETCILFFRTHSEGREHVHQFE